jgi:hypothetical protein
MTRHFLAFLALLTGLAAFNAPAHASYVDAMACDTSVSASANDDTSSDQIPANAPPSTASESEAGHAPARTSTQTIAQRPTVLMGIERAYE